MKHRKVHKDMMFVEHPLLQAIEEKIERYNSLLGKSDDAKLNRSISDWIKYLEKCLEKFKAKMAAGDEL